MGPSGFTISGCEISPIKYRPNRSKAILMFELRGRGPDGKPVQRSIVGRFTREYKEDRTPFDLMEELWQDGFGSDSDLRVCEPLLYVPARGLVLVSKASGTDLQTMSESASELLPTAAKRAADWIAKLHRTRVRNGRVRPMADEETTIRDGVGTAVAKLSSNHPSLSGRASGLVRRILAVARLIDKPSTTLVHGDYLPRNIFFDGSTVTAIDLDGCSLFDPAKDLGKLLGRLAVNVKLYDLPFREASLRSTVLSAYSEEVPEELLRRAAAYEAILFVKQSKREADPEAAEYWLDRAEERVDERH